MAGQGTLRTDLVYDDFVLDCITSEKVIFMIVAANDLRTATTKMSMRINAMSSESFIFAQNLFVFFFRNLLRLIGSLS